MMSLLSGPRIFSRAGASYFSAASISALAASCAVANPSPFAADVTVWATTGCVMQSTMNIANAATTLNSPTNFRDRVVDFMIVLSFMFHFRKLASAATAAATTTTAAATTATATTKAAATTTAATTATKSTHTRGATAAAGSGTATTKTT